MSFFPISCWNSMKNKKKFAHVFKVVVTQLRFIPTQQKVFRLGIESGYNLACRAIALLIYGSIRTVSGWQNSFVLVRNSIVLHWHAKSRYPSSSTGSGYFPLCWNKLCYLNLENDLSSLKNFSSLHYNFYSSSFP